MIMTLKYSLRHTKLNDIKPSMIEEVNKQCKKCNLNLAEDSKK